MNLFESFRRNREERPGEAAFLIANGDRSLPITWRQFTDDIETVAHLIRSTLPGGAVIGLLGENSYEWMVAHAACVFGGATVVPVEVALSAEEIAARLSFVGAKAFVYSSLYSDKARAVEKLVPGMETYGFGALETDRRIDEAEKALRGGERGVFSMPPPDAGRTSMIVFTSGTTSEPRGAELCVGGLEAFARFASATLPMKSGDRSLMLLPLHHIFGIATAYAMLAAGVVLGVCPDFRRIFDAVRRFRANFAFLVPALADILAAKISQYGEKAADVLDERLEWMLIGGAPMPQRAIDRIEALGIKVLTGYGLTETTSLFSLMPAGESAKAGCAGKVPDASSGVETKVSAGGELLIRGPNILRGYFKMPDRTAQAIDRDGWFHTGDIGRIDARGMVWIDGRASRTIVLSSGKKVAPEELEEKIYALPGVREVVVGREDGEGNRKIVAEIYASAGADEIAREIGKLNRTLPVFKRISRVAMRNTPFPRTSSGKISLALTDAGRRGGGKPPAGAKAKFGLLAFWVFLTFTGIAVSYISESIQSFFGIDIVALSGAGKCLAAVSMLVAATIGFRQFRARGGR